MGLDIERPGRTDYAALARRFYPHEFGQLECRSFGAGPGQTRFVRLWTAKEAYLKAVGLGLRRSLGSFRLCTDAEGRALEVKAAVEGGKGGDQCRFHVLPEPPGCDYVGTLATLGRFDRRGRDLQG